MEKPPNSFPREECGSKSITTPAYFVILQQSQGNGKKEEGIVVANRDVSSVAPVMSSGHDKSKSKTFLSAECKSGNITVTLDNNNMWNEFYRCSTEMVLTKQGRRMFPYCRYWISGLDPYQKYILVMDISPMDNHRYKWNGKWWEAGGKSEPHVLGRVFIHPESPSTGQYWMHQPVSFYKLKLTNNILDQEGHIILHSMHRYLPRLHVVPANQSTEVIQLNGPDVHTFTFPQTEFIAVTAYQNFQITQLKIDCNPFAKGFREGAMTGKPVKEAKSKNSDQENDSQGPQPHNDSESILRLRELFRAPENSDGETDPEAFNAEHDFFNCKDSRLSNPDTPRIQSDGLNSPAQTGIGSSPSVASSLDPKGQPNIVIKEEPVDDYDYDYGKEQPTGAINVKQESEEEETDEYSNSDDEYPILERHFSQFRKQPHSERKRSKSSPSGVAKAKMLKLDSGKLPVVYLESCSVAKSTLGVSTLEKTITREKLQRLLAECRPPPEREPFTRKHITREAIKRDSNKENFQKLSKNKDDTLQITVSSSQVLNVGRNKTPIVLTKTTPNQTTKLKNNSSPPVKSKRGRPRKQKQDKDVHLAKISGPVQAEQPLPDVNPDLEDVDGVLFVAFSSKEALDVHTDGNKKRDLSSSFLAPPASGEKATINKIRALEKQLVEDLQLMKYNQVIHPALQQVGLKLNIVDPTVTIDLRYLGVQLPLPYMSRNVTWDSYESCAQASRSPFVSRTGKTMDYTKIKGWKDKFSNSMPSSSNNHSSKPVISGKSPDSSLKNRSAFCSDELDEYLENEARLMETSGGITQNEPEPSAISQLPAVSTSSVKTIHTVLKKLISLPSPSSKASKPHAKRKRTKTPCKASTPKIKAKGKQSLEFENIRDNPVASETGMTSIKPSQESDQVIPGIPSLVPSIEETLLPSIRQVQLPNQQPQLRPFGFSKSHMKLLDMEENTLWKGKSRTYITEERADTCLVVLLTAQASLKNKPIHKVVRKQISPCNKLFCRLGCVCQSLNNKEHNFAHCRHADCMLECSCIQEKQLLEKDKIDIKMECTEKLTEKECFCMKSSTECMEQPLEKVGIDIKSSMQCTKHLLEKDVSNIRNLAECMEQLSENNGIDIDSSADCMEQTANQENPYSLSTRDSEEVLRTREQAKKRLKSNSAESSQQNIYPLPLEQFPIWKIWEDDADPEPICIPKQSELEECKVRMPQTEQLQSEKHTPPGTSKACGGSSHHMVHKDEVDPVYMFFDSLMTCARVRTYERKPPEEKAKLEQCNYESPDASEQDKRSKSRDKNKIKDIIDYIDKNTHKSECCAPTKLIEIISDCSWEEDRSKILNIVSQHMNKSDPQSFKVNGKYYPQAKILLGQMGALHPANRLAAYITHRLRPGLFSLSKLNEVKVNALSKDEKTASSSVEGKFKENIAATLNVKQPTPRNIAVPQTPGQVPRPSVLPTGLENRLGPRLLLIPVQSGSTPVRPVQPMPQTPGQKMILQPIRSPGKLNLFRHPNGQIIQLVPLQQVRATNVQPSSQSLVRNPGAVTSVRLALQTKSATAPTPTVSASVPSVSVSAGSVGSLSKISPVTTAGSVAPLAPPFLSQVGTQKLRIVPPGTGNSEIQSNSEVITSEGQSVSSTNVLPLRSGSFALLKLPFQKAEPSTSSDISTSQTSKTLINTDSKSSMPSRIQGDQKLVDDTVLSSLDSTKCDNKDPGFGDFTGTISDVSGQVHMSDKTSTSLDQSSITKPVKKMFDIKDSSEDKQHSIEVGDKSKEDKQHSTEVCDESKEDKLHGIEGNDDKSKEDKLHGIEGNDDKSKEDKQHGIEGNDDKSKEDKQHGIEENDDKSREDKQHGIEENDDKSREDKQYSIEENDDESRQGKQRGIEENNDKSREDKQHGIEENDDKSKDDKQHGIEENDDKSKEDKHHGIVENDDKSKEDKQCGIEEQDKSIDDKQHGIEKHEKNKHPTDDLKSPEAGDEILLTANSETLTQGPVETLSQCDVDQRISAEEQKPVTESDQEASETCFLEENPEDSSISKEIYEYNERPDSVESVITDDSRKDHDVGGYIHSDTSLDKESSEIDEAVDIETVEELSEKINIARLKASASNKYSSDKCSTHSEYLKARKKVSKDGDMFMREIEEDPNEFHRRTHTANERRRRNEMRDLFEELKNALGLHNLPKVSKSYILKQAIEEIEGLTDLADTLIRKKTLLSQRQTHLVKKVSNLSGKPKEVVLKKLEYIVAKQKAVEAERKKKNLEEDIALHKASMINAPLPKKIPFPPMSKEEPATVQFSGKSKKPIILAKKPSQAIESKSPQQISITASNLLMTPQGQLVTLKNPVVPGQVATVPPFQAEISPQVAGAGIASVVIQLPGTIQVKGLLGNASIPITLAAVPNTTITGVPPPTTEAERDDLSMMPKIVNVTSLANESSVDLDGSVSTPESSRNYSKCPLTDGSSDCAATSGQGDTVTESIQKDSSATPAASPSPIHLGGAEESLSQIPSDLSDCIESSMIEHITHKRFSQNKNEMPGGLIDVIGDQEDTDETITSLLNELAFLNQQLNTDDLDSGSDFPGSETASRGSASRFTDGDSSPFSFGRLKDLSEIKEKNVSLSPLFLHLEEGEIQEGVRQIEEPETVTFLGSSSKESLSPADGKACSGQDTSASVSSTEKSANQEAMWRPMPKLAPLGLKAAATSSDQNAHGSRCMPILAPVTMRLSPPKSTLSEEQSKT
ncbi:hypothetical protein XENTR_v10021880 [Xenopus tropicalis]|nr:hypothetical protein XENTR_v10021880 [Xenopus tropicalis]